MAHLNKNLKGNLHISLEFDITIYENKTCNRFKIVIKLTYNIYKYTSIYVCTIFNKLYLKSNKIQQLII